MNEDYPTDYGEYLEAEFDMETGFVRRSYEDWKTGKPSTTAPKK